MHHRICKFSTRNHLVTALLGCLLSPSAMATASLMQTSISSASNHYVDTVMPPLSTIPASIRVIETDAREPAQSMALATFASRAFPLVTADFARFWQTQAQLDYTKRGIAAKVRDPIAFAEMQRYLFNRYNGLTVVSTLHTDEQIFDCVPLAQQPGLRDGSAIASPPKLGAAHPDASLATSQTPRCQAGTVPLERITLQELAGHASLQDFLRKPSARAIVPARARIAPPDNDAAYGHFYSTVYFDHGDLPLTGAGADLNSWAPVLRSANETQTISQIWIVGESTEGKGQTLEAGWEAQPAAGWGSKPIVFIYSTQDDYEHTGCHNLDCSDFVQTSTKQYLGSAPPGGFSVAGGKQTVFSVEYQRNTDGNWWLRLNGEWIGYYKASLYSGDLAEGSANIYYNAGGEISTDDATPSPRMGSGQFASAGYRQAAFQANHFYRDADMNTYAAQTLSSVNVDSPSCYTLAIANLQYPYTFPKGMSKASPSPEMRNGGFYFGGPGCTR